MDQERGNLIVSSQREGMVIIIPYPYTVAYHKHKGSIGY